MKVPVRVRLISQVALANTTTAAGTTGSALSILLWGSCILSTASAAMAALHNWAANHPKSISCWAFFLFVFLHTCLCSCCCSCGWSWSCPQLWSGLWWVFFRESPRSDLHHDTIWACVWIPYLAFKCSENTIESVSTFQEEMEKKTGMKFSCHCHICL